MPQLSRELLAGAIDLHTHGYPEIRPDFGMELDDVAMALYARDAKMGGYVLKSHIWPTMDRVYHIRKQVSGIWVYASITLNTVLGGINPGVVETAAVQGAKVVFFPTWSAANDLRNGGFSRLVARLLPGLKCFMAEGLSVLTSGGGLTPEAAGVLEVARDAGLTVFTAHISPAETLALAAQAERIGFTRLVFSHPDSRSVGATEEDILAAAKMGAYIEFAFIGMLPHSQRISLRRVVELIQKVGPERCILTTDTFEPWSLPEPDLFRMYLAVLHDELKLSPETIRLMAVDNPRRLLDLPPLAGS